MRALQELAYIVKKNSKKSSELLPETVVPGTRVAQFYEGILDQRFTSDDEAAEFFFEKEKSNPSYIKLKSSLQKHLINSLFQIDFKQNSNTERQRAYYECNKQWAAVKILLGKNARTASINLSHKILKQAMRFEFTELVVEIARTLRLHYGARTGDLKKYEYYHDLFQTFQEIYRVENLAEGLYTELVVRYVRSKATNEEIRTKAIEYAAQLEPHMKQYESYRLHLCGNLIQVMIHTTINDYNGAITACEKAICFFEAKKYRATVPLEIWCYQQMVCFTQLRQFEQGKAAAERCANLMDEGSFNWFKYQELHFILSMHTKNYQQAYFVFNKVTLHKRFKYLPENVIESWKIFEAYLHYLIKVKRLVANKDDRRFNNFRLGRFLNETPIYSKDKRGMNIPILVIQILFMILHRKYDLAVDRIDAIEKYCTRYLRKNDTFRSNCFIKMLLLIPAAGFHKAGLRLKTEKYMNKLRSVPLDVANQPHEIEILPYEDLMELVLDSLENKFYKLKTKTVLIRK